MTTRHACLLAFAMCFGATAALADALEDCKVRSGDQAIAACDRAIRENPKASLPYFIRGTAYFRKGDVERALADYSRGFAINPDQPAGAYNERGLILRRKGDLDRAFADFNKAIELDPKLAAAYSNRGLIHRAKGELDRAIADHTKAIALDPKLAAAYNNRSNAYRFKGDLGRA